MTKTTVDPGKYNFDAYGTAHVPEDKDQLLVHTPYGRGLVVKTIYHDGDVAGTITNNASAATTTYAKNKKKRAAVRMREIELLDWKNAKAGAAADGDVPRTAAAGRPATLYAVTEFPSVQPQVGDDVLCPYGRGKVMEIRSTHGEQVVVRLSSWRLANRSRVTCVVDRSDVRAVRPKRLYEMSVYEKVEYAQQLKEEAAQCFVEKRYEAALHLYARAIESVRYVQHKTDSSNHVRADLVLLMITCSNNAATCCTHLSKHWDEAIKYANNALVLIQALEEKRGMKLHTLLRKEGYRDAKLFGEWRVKSYLILARCFLEKKDADEAMRVLQQARAVVAKYAATEAAEASAVDSDSNSSPAKSSAKNLLANEKEINKLYAKCQQQRKRELTMERKRAQAMFGSSSGSSASSSDANENIENTAANIERNGGADGKGTGAADFTAAILKRTMEAVTGPLPDIASATAAATALDNGSEEASLLQSPSTPMKKKVSFSSHVKKKLYDPKENAEGDADVDDEKKKAAWMPFAAEAIAPPWVLCGVGALLGVGLTLAGWHFASSSSSSGGSRSGSGSRSASS